MVLIPGAIGKQQAIFDFLVELQIESVLYETDSNANRKRRRIDSDSYVATANDQPTANANGTVQFPIAIPTIDPQTWNELLTEISKFEKQNLTVEWRYANIEDSIFAAINVISGGEKHLIAENECVIMSNQFQEDKTETIGNDTELLVAIIYAAHTSLVKTSNVKLCPSADRCTLLLHMDLVYNMNLAQRTRASKLMLALSNKLQIRQEQLQQAQPVDSSQEPKELLVKRNANNIKQKSSTASDTSIEMNQCNQQLALSPSLSSQASPLQLPTQPLQPLAALDPSIESFYQHVHPPVSNEHLEVFTSDKITAKLTPFQTQNVQWMIHREGHLSDSQGTIKPNHDIFNGLPLLYTGTHSDNDSGNYTNSLSNTEMTDRSKINELTSLSYRGGILADEMGLGKTVSVLSLIAKHTWSPRDAFHPKRNDYPNLIISTGTLIISPGSIVSQWESEIKRHAPSLKVYMYLGRRFDPYITAEQLAKYDIVLTHYEAFRYEIYYTSERPKRPSRKGVNYGNYTYSASPLISVFWYRCVLDEAQMIEAPLSQVASVSKMIPRWYSWAVTGTPIKDNLNDLYGLYDFLSLERTIHDPKGFQTLCTDPQLKQTFYEFARTTMRRNTKQLLADQIHIPKQHRHVVRIPFSTIEQHYYDDLWRACRSELRLDWLDSINWTLPATSLDATAADYRAILLKMRGWLLALRQNCIHPSMITNDTMRLTNQTSSFKRMHSLDEVLEGMKEAAAHRLDGNQYALYFLRLKRGGMYEVQKDWEHALASYTQNVPSVEKLVELHTKQVELKKQDEAESASNAAIALNKWQSLLHMYYFYMAGVYHTTGAQDLENLYYTKAGDLRRVLLRISTNKVLAHLDELKQTSDQVRAHKEYVMGARSIDDNFINELTHGGDDDEIKQEQGSETHVERYGKDADLGVLENVKHIGTILDRQFEKILYLRGKVLPILEKSLVDTKDDTVEATGDEYQDSLSDQELCQVYISAYEALLRDRKFIVKGITATLYDMLADNNFNNGAFVSEEAKKIESVEKAFRKQLGSCMKSKVECLKDLEFSLRTLKQQRAGPRKGKVYRLLDEEHNHIKSKLAVQTKLVDNLEIDLKKLTLLFNSKIAYYKSLQGISDTLKEWSHKHPQYELNRLQLEENKLVQTLQQNKNRDSYLKGLLEEQQSMDTTGEKQAKECLICQETIEKGMITYCGHTSCSDCGLRWFKNSKRCHTCNSQVRKNEWYNISYKRMEMQSKDTQTNDASGHRCASGSSTNDQEDAEDQRSLTNLISEINKQTIVKGQGAKLDNIIRHIQYIKATNNGKCVVFSQWSKTLEMLQKGLSANGIKFTSINTSVTSNKSKVSQFQEDPNINVILLHARSQSSGLTLVQAQTVFIVEPVLNESLEKQAINRIHRIGQSKETSVFWYIVQDTIEERIQAIHDVKRESKHHQNNASVSKKKQELSKASDGGGEFVSTDDLRRCFTSDESYALQR